MTAAPRVHDALAAGRAALARGAWQDAQACFDEVLAEVDLPEAWEGRSWVAWWLEDVTACLEARERAYNLYRRADDRRGAARMALWLGDDHIEFLGAQAIADGWFARVRRLLDESESSPEHGWLAVFEAQGALDAHDVATAGRLAARARELGRRHGDLDLEMFGLATEGVTLVDHGAVADGLRCLDEAAAAALGGEYENLAPAAWTCCRVLSACEQVRDYERGAQWCGKVEAFSQRMHTRFLRGVCRAHYGAILTWHGSWAAAEQELLDATDDLSANRPLWRPEALVRLADLRRRQGRAEEAEGLYEQVPTHPLTLQGLAALHLDRDDPAAARDALERALRRLPPASKTNRVGVLELLVRAEVALGEDASAAAHLAELRAIAAEVATPPLAAAVEVSEGLLAMAAGDHRGACVHFEDAVDAYTRSGAPFEAGRARVELARALAARGRVEAARHEAQAARDRLAELGAHGEYGRAGRLLDDLDPAASSRSLAEKPLTARQVEVLRLIADGCADKDIAARLVLSEHTVHRHVANIYTRLGCSSRAAAVAQAGRLGLL